MRLFRRLFGRRPAPAPIDEEEAYARSYGDRGGDLISVSPVKRTPEPVVDEPIPLLTADLTGELLRIAFETRLDKRHTTNK